MGPPTPFPTAVADVASAPWQSFPALVPLATFRRDWTDALGALSGAYDDVAVAMVRQLLARVRALASPALAAQLAAAEAHADGLAAPPASLFAPSTPQRPVVLADVQRVRGAEGHGAIGVRHRGPFLTCVGPGGRRLTCSSC
jgi:hypothetical protein